MGAIGLRRYRAERLLREEFEGLRAEVLAGVRGRLRARGVRLDGGDLEDCYAQAWQALYTAVLGGGEIANPGGWLAQVTFRRAIDEHRARRAHRCEAPLNRDSPARAAARGPAASLPSPATSPPSSTTGSGCATCSRVCAVVSAHGSGRLRRCAICRACPAPRRPLAWGSARAVCAS